MMCSSSVLATEYPMNPSCCRKVSSIPAAARAATSSGLPFVILYVATRTCCTPDLPPQKRDQPGHADPHPGQGSLPADTSASVDDGRLTVTPATERRRARGSTAARDTPDRLADAGS